jgi:hypothetical protein
VKEVPQFVVTSAKACCRANRTEATHGRISALDPSMVLFNAVVETLPVLMLDILAKLASDRARVTVMPVRGDPGRSDASHRFGRPKEFLYRRHIAALAQHDIHQPTSAVNRPIQIAPSAMDFDIGFIDVPGAADTAATTPATAMIVDQQRRELRLPIQNSLVGELDTTQKEHLRQIAQAQPVTQSPEDNECDDGYWARTKGPPVRSLNCRQSRQRNRR